MLVFRNEILTVESDDLVRIPGPAYKSRIIKVSRNGAEGDEYDDDERLYIAAMERWKRNTKHPFPANVEALRIAKRLGFRKVIEAQDCPVCNGVGKTGLKLCPECYGIGKRAEEI